MGTAKKIKILLVENDMTIKELAAELNMGNSTLYRKLTNDDFLESEVQRIAQVFGATSESIFNWPNGRKF